MKFVTAAAILTQTLPDMASAKLSTSSLLGLTVNNDHPRPNKVLISTAISTSDRNFKSLKNQASALLLKNSPEPADSIQACNPSSHDPDIGILSCGPGYECVVDDHDASMGGHCVRVDRELEEIQIDENAMICNLCGPGLRFDVIYWLLQLGIVGSVPTNIYLCAGLAYRAYFPALNVTSCLSFRDTAFTFGCCTSYEFGCDDICGDDKVFLPYATIAGTTTDGEESTTYCLETMIVMDTDECLGNEDAENTDEASGFIRVEVIENCCGDKPTDMPSMAPAIVMPGVANPPPANPTSSTTTSGSTSTSNGVWPWSIRTLVSVVSLMATITGVIMLK